MASNINEYVDSGIQWINSALTEASNLAKVEQARQQQGAQAVDALAANTADPAVNNSSSYKSAEALASIEQNQSFDPGMSIDETLQHDVGSSFTVGERIAESKAGVLEEFVTDFKNGWKPAKKVEKLEVNSSKRSTGEVAWDAFTSFPSRLASGGESTIKGVVASWPRTKEGLIEGGVMMADMGKGMLVGSGPDSNMMQKTGAMVGGMVNPIVDARDALNASEEFRDNPGFKTGAIALASGAVFLIPVVGDMKKVVGTAHDMKGMMVPGSDITRSSYDSPFRTAAGVEVSTSNISDAAHRLARDAQNAAAKQSFEFAKSNPAQRAQGFVEVAAHEFSTVSVRGGVAVQVARPKMGGKNLFTKNASPQINPDSGWSLCEGLNALRGTGEGAERLKNARFSGDALDVAVLDGGVLDAPEPIREFLRESFRQVDRERGINLRGISNIFNNTSSSTYQRMIRDLGDSPLVRGGRLSEPAKQAIEEAIVLSIDSSDRTKGTIEAAWITGSSFAQ